MTSSNNSNFVTVEELIQISIQFEKDSARFYKDMQSMTNDDNTIEILKLLEKEEEHHSKNLKEIDINNYQNQMIQFPPTLTLSMPELDKNSKINLRNMLLIAIEREKKSIEIYKRSSEMTKGSLKELLENLSHWESKHKEKLERLKSDIIGE